VGRIPGDKHEDVIRKRVVVSGRVQGVWFRESCREEAQERDVSGWVRNNPDGSVEAVFEGSDTGVAAMINWMKHGPSRAYVTDVRVTDEPPDGVTGFVVR
jgi:acylphosphatase